MQPIWAVSTSSRKLNRTTCSYQVNFLNNCLKKQRSKGLTQKSSYGLKALCNAAITVANYKLFNLKKRQEWDNFVSNSSKAESVPVEWVYKETLSSDEDWIKFAKINFE